MVEGGGCPPCPPPGGRTGGPRLPLWAADSAGGGACMLGGGTRGEVDLPAGEPLATKLLGLLPPELPGVPLEAVWTPLVVADAVAAVMAQVVLSPKQLIFVAPSTTHCLMANHSQEATLADT